MKITKRQLRESIRSIIREWSGTSQLELEDYGLTPGARETLTSDLMWRNTGGLDNPPSGYTAWLSAGSEIEVGSADSSGARIEVYDVGRNKLFTVHPRDLIQATER